MVIAPIRPQREAVELPHPLHFPRRDERAKRGDGGDGA
jgi:hypothetical protein